MSRDSQRYRKVYSYYRPQPRTELLEIVVDETLDWKNSVRTASTTNHPLSGGTSTLSIGGVTVVDEDRVLLKSQSDGSENGIYYFEVTDGSYALTRASDARQETLSCGAATYVEEGTNGGKIYILSTTNPINLGSTNLTWTEFSSGGGGTAGPEYWSSTTLGAIYSTGSVAIRGGLGTVDAASDVGSNVFFFVSGSITGSGTNDKKSLFGGDVVMSGTLEVAGDQVEITGSLRVTNGISGSLTRLTDGTSYLIAGSNVSIITGSNGAVTISSTGGGGGGGGSQYWLESGANKIYSTGSVGIGTTSIDGVGPGAFFFVSGTISSPDATGKASVFGGDAKVSGSLTIGRNSTTFNIFSSLPDGSSGAPNIIVGTGGKYLTRTFGAEGSNNIYFGFSAGFNSTTAQSNIYVGPSAGYNTTDGSRNVAIGFSALSYSTTGHNNVAVGASAGSGMSGVYNVAIGANALLADYNGGYSNTAIGCNSFMWLNNSTAANNVALGDSSGRWYGLSNSNLTNAQGSLFIGAGSKPDNDGESNQIVIGSGSLGLGSNTTVLGNSLTTKTYLAGKVGIGTTTISDSLTVSGSTALTGSLYVSGDTMEVTGTLSVTNGITGSITKLTNGTNYLLAGSGIQLTTGSTGQVTIAATGGGGGVGGSGTENYLSKWSSGGASLQDSVVYNYNNGTSGGRWVGIGTSTMTVEVAGAVNSAGYTIMSLANGSGDSAIMTFDINGGLSGSIVGNTDGINLVVPDVASYGVTLGSNSAPILRARASSGNVEIIRPSTYFDASIASAQGIKLSQVPQNSNDQVLDCYFEKDLPVGVGCDTGSITLNVLKNTLKMTRMGRTVTVCGSVEVDWTSSPSPTGRLWLTLGTTAGSEQPVMDTACAVYIDSFSPDFDKPVQGYVEQGTDKLWIDILELGSKQSSPGLATYTIVGSIIKVMVTYVAEEYVPPPPPPPPPPSPKGG